MTMCGNLLRVQVGGGIFLSQAHFKSKELSNFYEARCYSLQSWLNVNKKGSVVGKQNLFDHLLHGLRVGLQLSWASSSRCESGCSSSRSLRSFSSEHCKEEHREQSESTNTTLFQQSSHLYLERMVIGIYWSSMTMVRNFNGQPIFSIYSIFSQNFAYMLRRLHWQSTSPNSPLSL